MPLVGQIFQHILTVSKAPMLAMTYFLQPKSVLFCRHKAFDDFQGHLVSHKGKCGVESGCKGNTNSRQNSEKRGKFMYYGPFFGQYLGPMGPNSNFSDYPISGHLKRARKYGIWRICRLVRWNIGG